MSHPRNGAAPAVPFGLLILSSVALSALVGWLDYNADEVQGTVLLLIVLTGVLAFAAPNRAWLPAVIMGLSVIGAQIVGAAIGVAPRFPVTPPAAGLIALIPAAIGAALGVGARAMFRSATTR